MGRRDSQTMFNAVGGQAITASAASSNSVDLVDSLHQIGDAVKDIMLVVRVNQTFNTLTSLDVALQDSADNSSFADTAIKIPTILLAKLTIGTQILRIPLPTSGSGAAQVGSGQLGVPPEPNSLRRYLRMNYTVNGSNPTLGIIDAWLEIE